MRSGAVLQAGFRPVEILAQQDVHHACNGVGSIDGRRAVRQDLDTLHRGEGDGAHIDELTLSRRCDAPAVDERQRRHRAQAVQVEAGAAAQVLAEVGRAAERSTLRCARRAAFELQRQRLDELHHVRVAGPVDVLAIERQDRHRVVLDAADVRAGYEDFADDVAVLERRRIVGARRALGLRICLREPQRPAFRVVAHRDRIPLSTGGRGPRAFGVADRDSLLVDALEAQAARLQ